LSTPQTIEPFTGLELGILAIALVDLRRDQSHRKDVLDAIESISKKLGIENSVKQGGKSWRQFRASLARDLEGGAA
jgi:hypothetical protein